MHTARWSTTRTIYSASAASVLMLYLTPMESELRGFLLWSVFFSVLLWPPRVGRDASDAREQREARPAEEGRGCPEDG